MSMEFWLKLAGLIAVGSFLLAAFAFMVHFLFEDLSKMSIDSKK